MLGVQKAMDAAAAPNMRKRSASVDHQASGPDCDRSPKITVLLSKIPRSVCRGETYTGCGPCDLSSPICGGDNCALASLFSPTPFYPCTTMQLQERALAEDGTAAIDGGNVSVALLESNSTGDSNLKAPGCVAHNGAALFTATEWGLVTAICGKLSECCVCLTVIPTRFPCRLPLVHVLGRSWYA